MLSRHVFASLAQWEDHVFSRLDLAFQLMQDNVFLVKPSWRNGMIMLAIGSPRSPPVLAGRIVIS